MKKLANQGFGALGVLAVIVVVAAVAAGGWYVYHKNHTKKTTTTTTTSQSSNSQATTNANDSANKQIGKAYTSNDALNLVQSAYTTALAYVKQTTNAGQGEIDAIKSSLSSDLYAKLSANAANAGHDQILCGQARPDSFTTTLGSSTGGTVVVFVNEVFGSSNVKVTTTVDLMTLKITDITCPQ